MKKLFSIFCLLLALVCLASCNDQNQPNPDGKSEFSATTGFETPIYGAEPLKLIENGKTKYQLVYSQNADVADQNAVAKLRASFQSKTGVSITSCDDFVKEGETHENDTCKILVGPTNYAESQAVYPNMKYNEYLVTVSGTHLVVMAFHEEGYTKAIDWLEKQVFSNISGEGEEKNLIMKAETYSGSTGADYEVSSWKIAGTDLESYRIVYGDTAFTKNVMALRREIGEKTGYYLDVVADTATETQEYEILFGDTNRAESSQVETPNYLNYILRVVNNKLVVKAGGEHSFTKLLDEFFETVVQDSVKVNMGKSYQLIGDYFTDPYKTSPPEDSDIRIMTANVQANLKGYNSDNAEGFTFERRLEIFLATLDFYQPTVVGLQEFCMSWNKGVKTYRDIDKWDILEFENPRLSTEFVLSTIMYRKDLYELVDSGMQYYSVYNNGRCRCYTWAVLKVKATGEEFCFVSTHWDGGETADTMTQVSELTAFVNEMAKKYPVFTTGDFNSNEWTKAFSNLLINTNSVDCMHAAVNRLNAKGSYHGWGKDTASAGSCDHITATSKDVTVLQFETLMYNEQIYGSDHAWLVADIQFKD